jgi:hypothetical protein
VIKHPPVFKQLANDNAFREWLALERAEAIRNLATQTEPLGMFRAQGRLTLLNEMEAALK